MISRNNHPLTSEYDRQTSFLQVEIWSKAPFGILKLHPDTLSTQAWCPYDLNDHSDRNTTIQTITMIAAINGFQMITRIARRWTWRSQRSPSIQFSYNRNDRSDHSDRCAAILAIIWKPILSLLISRGHKQLTYINGFPSLLTVWRKHFAKNS